MQVAIRNLSETRLHPDYRWDSEYLCFEQYKNPNLKYVSIGNVLKFSQYGISIKMNEDGNGTKIYRMNEISNILCNRNVSKYAEIDASEIKSYNLHDRDVLFNRTNSQVFVGRTGIFKKFSDEDIVFASYLIRISPKSEIVTPEYLTAFLNTKYGILDVKRRARISINQSNVNAEELKRVEIPLLCSNLQKVITNLFNRAFFYINSSESKYKETQNILLSELGLFNWQPKHQISFIKNYSDTDQAGRIDAEYYQPKYEEIVKAIKGYSGGWDTLGNLCELVGHPSNPPYANTDDADKTFIVTQKHLGDFSLNEEFWDDEDALYTTKEFITKNSQYLLNQGDVLLYSVGAYIGKANIYREDIKATIGSFLTLLRAKKEKLNPYYLMSFLNTDVGIMISKRHQRGMAQQYLYPYDIRTFPIPILSEEKQTQIQQKVTESFNLRKQSKRLLECAKRAVEMAIEQNEQTAISWIENQVEFDEGDDADCI